MSSQTTSPTKRDHEIDSARLLGQFADAWAARDLDGVMACFHREAVYIASVGPEPGQRAQGTQAIRDLIVRMFALDDCIDQSLSEPLFADNAAFWTWSYRLRSGRELRGCDLFEFRDGLIVLKDAYRKTAAEPSNRESQT